MAFLPTLSLAAKLPSESQKDKDMQIRKSSARIASVLLVLHGLIEIAGLVLVNSLPLALISFGGLAGPALEQNTSTIAMFGVFWGIARLIAAWGSWSLRKWALLLGILLSLMTLIAAISIIPAGVTDTLFAVPVLIFLLYAWFGNDMLDIKGV
jgi:hypothetical protein